METTVGFVLTVLRDALTRGLLTKLRKRPRPAHVLFCMVDHFEPGLGMAPAATQRARVQELLEKYPPLADEHRDAFGNRPRRSWFFPPHDHVNGSLRDLAALCARGYGEIELHLHHGKTGPDTAENLARTIRLCLRDYAQFGIFGCEGGEKRYGFVHGDWALNNSRRGGKYCGVNNELEILQQTGCYADFTFPSCKESNPAQVNSIYYADVKRHVPRSCSRGIPVRAGATHPTGLMIVQGPVRIVRAKGRISVGDGIHNRRHATKVLLDSLVGAWIHVAGKNDWVIVKTHTHGSINAASVLGPPMHDGFSYLEEEYNDGKNFILHYVTARELYNIIKAAEAGEQGNPEQYRNYLVERPRYDPGPNISEASKELREAVERTYRG
jgi:hypothetical protein